MKRNSVCFFPIFFRSTSVGYRKERLCHFYLTKLKNLEKHQRKDSDKPQPRHQRRNLICSLIYSEIFKNQTHV